MWLEEIKWWVEEEKRAEEQCVVEKAVEWRRAALAVLSPEAVLRGTQRGPIMDWGLSSLRKTACGASHKGPCAFGNWIDAHGVVGSANSSKNLAGGSGPHWLKRSGGQRMRARGQKRGGGSKQRRWRGCGRTRAEGFSWGPRSLRCHSASMIT